MVVPSTTPIICPLMVGRDSKLAWLRLLLEQAKGGQGQMALLCGEAGIGKSRLISEVKRDAATQNLLLLQGNCFPADHSFPYAPLLDLLRTLFAHLPSTLNQDVDVETFAQDIFPLLPDLASAQMSARPQLEPEQEKRRLFAVLSTFFTGLAAHQPVLFIIEDIHWSDDTSLEFLHYLARSCASQSLLIIASYRNDEIHPRLRSWLAQLDRERLARELQLTCLTRENIEMMLAAIFEPVHTSLDMRRFLRGDLLDTIVALTEGNPFFVEEILTSLIDAGTIFYVSGYWNRTILRELHIPRSIQDAVQRRTEHISGAARNVLTLAAVAGRRFDFTLLQYLTHSDEEQLLACMKELLQAQLVVEESIEQFVFRHALTRQAIYTELMARERKRLHFSIAEALEQLQATDFDVSPGDLAYHFYEAGAWQKAMDYATLAGKQALALYTPRAAIDHFTRAIDAATHLALSASPILYRSRGQAYETLGDFEQARIDYMQALEASRKGQDSTAEWQSTIDLGFLWSERDYSQTEVWFRQALSLAQALHDPSLNAHSLNRIGNWHLNVEQPLEAKKFHQEALHIFQEQHDDQGIAETLDLLGMASYLDGDLIQGTRYYQQAIACFRELDDRYGLTSSLASLGLSGATYQTDSMVSAVTSLEEALQSTKQGLKIARGIGQRPAEVFALLQVGLCLGSQGNYEQALDALHQCLQIAEEIEHRQWQTAAHAITGGLYHSLGDFPQARQQFEHAQTIAQEIKSLFWTRIVAGYFVSTCVMLHDFGRAEALLSEIFSPTEPAQTMAQRLIWCASAELALARSNPVHALEIVERLQTSAAQLIGEKPALRVAKLHGEVLTRLQQYEQAEIALLAAQDIAISQGARPMQWRIATDLGMLYREQARKEEADIAFSQARAIIEELAANLSDETLRKCFLQNATVSLPSTYRQSPASPRQQARKAPGGLTERECEIALLIAQGQSNQKIADALFVTKRTIETHVSNILFKLNANSRAQIAVWITEAGLAKKAE